MTLIVDAHEDIAWNMMCYGRDYTQSVKVTLADGTIVDKPVIIIYEVRP